MMKPGGRSPSRGLTTCTCGGCRFGSDAKLHVSSVMNAPGAAACERGTAMSTATKTAIAIAAPDSTRRAKAPWLASRVPGSVTNVSTAATVTRPAPTRKARLKPAVSASAVDSPSPISAAVRCVASEISTARPSPPPTCRAVLTRLEVRPASWGAALCVAAIVDATTDRPMPAATRMPGNITYWIALPPAPMRDSSSSPTASISSPAPSTARTPARPASFPAGRATAKIVSAIGRKTRPVSSGDSASTCCRYSEQLNHITNSEELKSSTIRLIFFSSGVSARGGINGSSARFS